MSEAPPAPAAPQFPSAPGSPTAGPDASQGPTGPAQKRYQVQLVNVRSLVIVSRRTEVVHTGTLEELDQEAKNVFRGNMLAGWWGLAGIYWTAVALGQNRSRMKKLHEYAGQLEGGRQAAPPAGQ